MPPKCHRLGQCCNPPPGNLRCPICGELAKDAVKSDICGHTYGMQCVLAKLVVKEACPMCGVPMDASDLKPCDAVRDAVNDTRVECREGHAVGCGRCNWTGPLSKESSHAHGPECGVHKVQCPFCRTYIEKGAAFEQHQSICDEATVICPQCSEDMPRRELMAHQRVCKASLPVPLKKSNELLKKMATNAAVPAKSSTVPKQEPAEAAKPQAAAAPAKTAKAEKTEKQPKKESTPVPKKKTTNEAKAAESARPSATPKSVKSSAKKAAKEERLSRTSVTSTSSVNEAAIPTSMAEIQRRLKRNDAPPKTAPAAADTVTPARRVHVDGASPMLDTTVTPAVSSAMRGTGIPEFCKEFPGGNFTICADDTLAATPEFPHRAVDSSAMASIGTNSGSLFTPSPAMKASPKHRNSEYRRSHKKNSGPRSSNAPTGVAGKKCPFASLGCGAQHSAADMLKPSVIQQHMMTLVAQAHAADARCVALELQNEQQQAEIDELRAMLKSVMAAQKSAQPSETPSRQVKKSAKSPRHARKSSSEPVLRPVQPTSRPPTAEPGSKPGSASVRSRHGKQTAPRTILGEVSVN